MNPVLESRSGDLQRFQDALDAARAKGPRAYDEPFDAPPEGLSVHEIDTNKILMHVSAAHEGLLGYPLRRMTGLPVSSFVILKEVSEMAMSRKLSGTGQLETSARAFLKADGSGITLLQLDRHLLDASGKVRGIRTVLTAMPPTPPPTGTWTRPPGLSGGAAPGGAPPRS